MLPICSNYNLIEDTLRGDQRSVLELGKSLYSESDSDAVSRDLEIRLATSQSTDNAQYTALCKALLQAHSEKTYKSAKQAFKACLDTPTQNSSTAKMLLICIRSFLSNDNFENKVPKIIKIFEEALTESKQTSDCFFEIQVKEKYLEFLLDHCSDPEKLESGLQLQLSLIDDLNHMDISNGFEVEKLIKTQTERYLLFIIKFFGKFAPPTDLENEAKKILVAAIDNRSLSDQQRNLAKYHLANLLLMNLSTCDIPKSCFLFKDLLKKLDEKSPYFFYVKFALIRIKEVCDNDNDYSILTESRYPLASIVKQEITSDFKVKIYYNLALSYLPKNLSDSDHFDLQNAEIYFHEVQKLAHPSSFLISLAHYQLGCILLFKEGDKNQNLVDAADHLKQASECNRINTQLNNRIHFFKEMVSNANVNETNENKNSQAEKNKNANQYRQMTFHGLQVIAGENGREIVHFYERAEHCIDVLIEKNFCNSINDTSYELRNKIKETTFNNKCKNWLKETLISILKYFVVKEKEQCCYLEEFQELPLSFQPHQNLHDSTKTVIEFNYKPFVDELNELISSTESNYLNSGLFFKISDCHVKTLIRNSFIGPKLYGVLPIPDKVAAGAFLSAFNDLGTIHKENKRLSLEIGIIIKEITAYFSNSYRNLLGNDFFVKMTLDELLFFFNMLTIALNHLKRSHYDLIGVTSGLAGCYGQLSILLNKNKKQRNNLALESARLLHLSKMMRPINDINSKFWSYNFIFIDQYLQVFLCEKDNYKKYMVIGKEILSFGIESIEEYIHAAQRQTGAKFPAALFVLIKVYVELLRFHDRENEANDLIHYILSHPVFSNLKNAIKEAKNWLDEIELIPQIHSLRKDKFNSKEYPELIEQLKTTEGLGWIPPFKLSFETNIKSKKRGKTANTRETSPQNAPKDHESVFQFSEAQSAVSPKAEAKKKAREVLENQERKQRLKENRIPKCLLPVYQLPVENLHDSPKTCPIKIITPTGMEIFNRLWQPNSGSLHALHPTQYDPHDYRNDVSISREDVIKLIGELGGEFREEQGKGSHGKGAIPSIFQSPQIIFGENSMTLADFEGGMPTSQTVILPHKSPNLKFYQIIQLRSKLIALRYTPDSVKEKKDEGQGQ